MLYCTRLETNIGIRIVKGQMMRMKNNDELNVSGMIVRVIRHNGSDFVCITTMQHKRGQRWKNKHKRRFSPAPGEEL